MLGDLVRLTTHPTRSDITARQCIKLDAATRLAPVWGVACVTTTLLRELFGRITQWTRRKEAQQQNLVTIDK